MKSLARLNLTLAALTVLGVTPAFAGPDEACPDVPGQQKPVAVIDLPAVEKEANAGSAEAAITAAKEYAVQKNYSAAEKFYRLALYKNDGRGALGLFELAQGGHIKLDDAEATRQYGMNLIEADAKKGNGGSAVSLGMFYLYGEGVEKDYDLAKTWFELAEAGGKPVGSYMLGLLYTNGLHYDAMPRVAFNYFAKGAAGGIAASTRQVAVAYHTGIGAEKNLEYAITCYTRSAAQGDMLAMRDLGNIYKFERPNAGLSESWYKKAAALGDPDSHYMLAEMYKNSRPQEAKNHYAAAVKVKHHLSRIEADPTYVPHE